MPWAMAVGTVGSAIVGGLFGSSSAKKQARAMKDQTAVMREQTQLGRDQLDWSKQQYGDWKDRFDPLFNQMISEMDVGTTPNYAAIAGDVKSSFQSAKDQERRNMLRYGVRPQDGAMASADRQYGIREAGAHVGARSQARENAKGIKYGRLQNAVGLGYGAQPQMMANVGNAASNLSNIYGQQAGQYGVNAGYWGQQAVDTAAGWGNMLGSLDWGGMWNSMKGWFNKPSSDAASQFSGSWKA